MDDAAFRASVYAEQKQLAAFSQQSPAERRRLVLQLLGVTPLELARDRARRDSRAADDQLRQLRRVLPDLDQLRAGLVEAEEAADTAKLANDAAQALAEEAGKDLEAARVECERREGIRQQHDLLVERGRAMRNDHDSARRRADELATELAELEGAAAQLSEKERDAEGLGESEEALTLVEAVVRAQEAVAAVQLPARPVAPDEAAAEEAQSRSAGLRSEAAELGGRLAGATAERERAERAVALSAELSGEGQCPTCGQPLGGAFEQVQSHRAAELAEAHAAADRLVALKREAESKAKKADRRATELGQELREARALWTQWERIVERREAAVSDLTGATASLEKAAARTGCA
jgi:DNA repair exonuclease SbcCD ATPase subunit